jgi:hypothetical protein
MPVNDYHNSHLVVLGSGGSTVRRFGKGGKADPKGCRGSKKNYFLIMIGNRCKDHQILMDHTEF